MRTLLLISLLSILFIRNSEAQETASGKSKDSFIEWNFGAAYVTEIDYILPGTSVLWGKTYIDEYNVIFEYEAGFALPSLVTGKVGIGKKFNNTKVIFGVRPFPFNLYLQSSFTKREKGYWITSIEFNPIMDDSNIISFGSAAIWNFGYRWNIHKDK